VTIGDQVMQESNTRHLIFTIPYLIAYLSQVMTLEPGDVISTGTPGGVGFARKPPRFLQPGDVVHVEIEGLGTLSNPVVSES
jgi:acylpyruvate hydrolase